MGTHRGGRRSSTRSARHPLSSSPYASNVDFVEIGRDRQTMDTPDKLARRSQALHVQLKCTLYTAVFARFF
ncbi:unnamed protein product [Boreogadus saida]